MATLIGLVGCGKGKLDDPAPARELYTGTLFRYASAYAERACGQWFVLSARHGLVHPNQVLRPYDRALTDFDNISRYMWAVGVARALDDLGLNKPQNRFMILAGKVYREHLVPMLHGPVVLPLKGLGIGQQVAWLKEALSG